MRILTFNNTLVTLLSLLLISCGGGGGSTQTAGIGGTGITSSGTITGFGSIFVNGVEFDTSSPALNVTLNGESAPNGEDDLKKGMTVTVRGSLDQNGTTGNAISVSVISELEGPIAASPIEDTTTNTKSFTVLERPVIVSTSGTIFDGSSFTYSNIAQNDVVEVSGYLNSSGALVATRIEKTGTLVLGSTQVEIKGTVSNATLTPSSIELNVNGETLIINHSGSTDFSGMNGNTVTNGQSLEIEGTLNNSTEIAATEISLQSSILGNQDDEIEIEGIITDYVSNADFKVNGQRIDASGTNVTFSPASLQTELANDVKVEVDGTLNTTTNMLIADEVESKTSEIKIFATVASGYSGSNTIPMTYSGQTIDVIVNTNTILEDETSNNPFSIADISSGDYLELEALQINGTVIALSIHRDDFEMNGSARLKGTITAFDTSTSLAETVTILGVEYPSNAATVFKEEVNDVSVIISRSAFLSKLTANTTVVKVKDRYINGSLDGIADEMEIDN